MLAWIVVFDACASTFASSVIARSQVSVPGSDGEHAVLIDASGSMATLSSSGLSAELQTERRRSSGPKMSGFKNNDCGGEYIASVMLPRDTDLTGDRCVELRDAETDKPFGMLKVFCEGDSGTAKFCIYSDPYDTTCETTAPMCLNVAPEDTPMVSEGNCVPVKEHPNEKEAFWKFEDFPPETKWPECLVPPLPMSKMLLVVTGGVLIGIVINCLLWYGVFGPEEPEKPKYGKGWGNKGGFGEYGGKGKM